MGGSEERAQALKDYYNNVDLKLTIKDKDVVMTNRFDVKELFEADSNVQDTKDTKI